MKRAIILFLTLPFLATGLRAETGRPRVEVYPLGFADGPTVKASVEALVGPEGSVVLDPASRRLVVIATPDQHDQIKHLVKQLDVRPKNVRIEVEFDGAGESREQAFGVRGRGRVVVGTGGTDARIRLTPRLQDTTTRSEHRVTQMIMVSSGREGRLAVGERIPYPEWFMEYGLRWGYIQTRVAWEEVGAFLAVKPVVVGDGSLVHVTLTPELSGMVDGKPHRVRYARAATEVTVRPGETISLGGLNKDEQFYSRFLVGRDRAGGTSRMDIRLTPTVVDTF